MVTSLKLMWKKGKSTGWNNDNMSSHLNNNPPENLKGYFVVQFKTPDTNDKGTYEDYEILSDVTTQLMDRNQVRMYSFDTSECNTVE